MRTQCPKCKAEFECDDRIGGAFADCTVCAYHFEIRKVNPDILPLHSALKTEILEAVPPFKSSWTTKLTMFVGWIFFLLAVAITLYVFGALIDNPRLSFVDYVFIPAIIGLPTFLGLLFLAGACIGNKIREGAYYISLSINDPRPLLQPGKTSFQYPLISKILWISAIPAFAYAVFAFTFFLYWTFNATHHSGVSRARFLCISLTLLPTLSALTCIALASVLNRVTKSTGHLRRILELQILNKGD